jgi:hypothetical protein
MSVEQYIVRELKEDIKWLIKRMTEIENKIVLSKDEKQKRQEAEKENDKLKADLARAKEDHQFDNLVHKKELTELNKK